ncbi:MAG: CBS and ACT domain-containing protein [Chitinophagales bacterium]
MRVRDKMSVRVIVISPDASIEEAYKLMRERNVRRLPVIERGKMIGMITRSDIYRAAPSSVVPMQERQQTQVMAKTKVRDVLPANQQLVTINQDAYIEQAAKIMSENKLSGLPVVDDDGKLIGIISVVDILNSLLEMLGVNSRGTRINLKVKDDPEVIRNIADIMCRHNEVIENIVQLDSDDDSNLLIVRINSVDNKEILDELKAAGYIIESIIVKH